MHIAKETLCEITEGKTKLIVPKRSISDTVPPKKPVFFNPRAKLSRDLSLIVYKTFLSDFVGPKIFLDGLAGMGVRGLRVANELDVERVIVNDLNLSAIKLARESAKINDLSNVDFSENETCRFFSNHSLKDRRSAIVDIDPFGSPAPFFDCGLRATMHGGILSCTATDLQVLNGLFDDACSRRYGGIPTRTKYGNEIAIRLVLGCLRVIAGRLDMSITPIFAESNMHYYRMYVKISNKPDQRKNMGFIIHCVNCKYRKISPERKVTCELCGAKSNLAGPLWIGSIFEEKFVQNMNIDNLTVGKNCEKILAKALLEADMPGTYYTLDEIAAKTKSSPPKLDDIIYNLQSSGFLASPTSFSPTGFRTNAPTSDIEELFYPV